MELLHFHQKNSKILQTAIVNGTIRIIALITPHLTVKDVFEANDQEIEEVAKAITEVTKNHGPFELNVSKVSTFAPITNTIYFKAVPNDELLNLHKDLNYDFFGDEPEYSFVPHITIAQKLIFR